MQDRPNQHRKKQTPKQSGTAPVGRILAFIAFIVAVVAGIAAFGNNIVSIWDDFRKLFGQEKIAITVHDAAMTIVNPPPSDLDKYFLEMRFFAVMAGGGTNQKAECSGEGLEDAKVVLLSKNTKKQSVFVEAGEQVAILDVFGAPTATSTFNPTILNFRLDCGQLGKTPLTPVKVTVANVEKQQAGPPHPTQSFRVCMGNGGGPACNAGAAASYTCSQYRAIGGGAQLTYDTLAKQFCEYKDGDKTVLAPNKVIHDFSVGGGECGWTGFTVVCNP